MSPNIEKIYIDPTSSYIYESFRLLSDCAFDEKTNFWYRGVFKNILPYLLLYKFWKGQTSKNLLLKVCRFDELITKSTYLTDMSEENIKEMNMFLSYINEELEYNG